MPVKKEDLKYGQKVVIVRDDYTSFNGLMRDAYDQNIPLIVCDSNTLSNKRVYCKISRFPENTHPGYYKHRDNLFIYRVEDLELYEEREGDSFISSLYGGE